MSNERYVINAIHNPVYLSIDVKICTLQIEIFGRQDQEFYYHLRFSALNCGDYLIFIVWVSMSVIDFKSCI